MAVGARIRNEGGSLVQIDAQFECLCLKSTSTQVANSFTFSGGATVGKVYITESGCNEPLISVYCSSSAIGILSKTRSGNSVTWEVITAIPNASFTYWIFDTTNVASMAFVSNSGLRIKSESTGSVIFDSRYKYMRIISQIDNDVKNQNVTNNIPISSGYAISISESGFYFNVVGGYVGGPPNWRIQSTANVAGVTFNNDGTVTTRLIGLSRRTEEGTGTPPPTGSGGSGRFQGLVLDMRNY